jgi:sigma-E factor negative regulatory protein RseC
MEASVCIEQKGTVENISSHNIRVRIRREASCGQCNARGMCFVGDGTERIIDISEFTPGLKIGDHVGIIITRSMGNKAILLGYLVPFLLLISTLIVLNLLGAKEWLSGLLSLASLVPYFILLYLLRNRLRKTFTLSARKNEY